MENSLLGKVVAISVALFVSAILLPVALETMGNASFGNADSTVVTIATILLPVLAVIGIALYFLRDAT